MKHILILDKKYSHKLFISSHFIIFPALIALYMQLYISYILCVATFITSTNYWKHPIHGFRRNLDVIVVVSNVSYHIIHYNILIPYNIYLALFYYLLALFYGRVIKDQATSSLFHFLFHCTIYSSLCILYIQ